MHASAQAFNPAGEAPLRRALLERLHTDVIGGNSSGCLIVEELGLWHGVVRADVAVIGSELHGFEIKSDSDNMQRLPEQVNGYSEVFDRSSVVVGPKHLGAAARIVPKWWGILLGLQTRTSDRTRLIEVRPAQANPSPSAIALSHLLWRDEVLKSLEVLSAADGLHDSPRTILYERLTRVASYSQVREIVVSAIINRDGWRAASQLR